MRRRPRTRKKGGSKIVSLLLLLGLAIGAGYLYTSPKFERVAPQIHSSDRLLWNRKEPLKIKLTDNIGLKHFELILSDGKKRLIIGRGDFTTSVKEQTLLVKYPKSKVLDVEAKELTLQVSVTDSSLWNLFEGNHAQKQITIDVDYKRPNVNLVAHSNGIRQGGSALVVFQAEDEHLKEVYIEAGGRKFKAQPYKKAGFYVALIAWPFQQSNFGAKVVATDEAGNTHRITIPFYIQNHTYKVSWIRASDKFINGKISQLAASNPAYASIHDPIAKLKAVNETMRLKNEELIHELSKRVATTTLNHWKIKKFYPLKNSMKVASYGDERHYYYESKDQEVSRSYHVGYDLASTRMAGIKASNGGVVVYAGENGIYGNMPMIDHGLGLYTLYGHCSQLLVKEGDRVKAGETIAKTGVSGLALGDHLHFGILVQGVEVRPVEWFDGGWIRSNIDSVFSEADRIIAGE